ncbi:MAG TPA: MG2 domain-containing protein, partial [Pyrinomonadaceae bacterium]|nr:MG2 domain-containing protein [Pyrinomonadaceae bacterium]
MKVLRIRFQATRIAALLVYVLVIVAALSLADHRLRNAAEAAPLAAPAEVTVDPSKPFFSLSSNRSFGTSENPRLWLDYRGIGSLDFRVYRVNDPARFFAQLSDPHQMGKDEEEQLTTKLTRKPSLLERIRSVKTWAYSGIRNYFREQLKNETRYSFNQKFRAPDTISKRTPLNVADYARVPLLNPNQLVTSWREPLPALENAYDRRMVPLGKREPGVYLVEAVGQELRAYTIVVVTDLAMVEKSSPNGELLVYAVDRRTGAPRADTQIEIVKAQKPLAAGRTNAEGLFRTKIDEKKDEELGEPEIPQVDNNGYVILASQRENFAVSDLESYYFSDQTGAENVQGYIYTDRPIYRPTHQVFFKGILRTLDEQNRYRSLKSQTVSVSVKDPSDAQVYQQELRLSSRGTFHGELTLADEAPLGVYQIEAATDEGSSTGSFEVAEYKKPEYKVTVTAPQRFVPAGGKSKFEINARYFFGAPVANADVKYYIYRSRYYPSYWQTDDEESGLDDEIDYSDYGGYGGDMVLEGEGKLDASGRLAIDFDVPSTNEEDVWDSQYRLEAQITDASRRSITGTASLIATRGTVIARATPERYVYTPGQIAPVKVSTTDYEGRPVSAKVTL